MKIAIAGAGHASFRPADPVLTLCAASKTIAVCMTADLGELAGKVYTHDLFGQD